MKKVLVLVMLTMSLFSYENNQYYNPNLDVVTLFCKATSLSVRGEIIYLNDRNRKHYGVDQYSKFIKTRSWFYPVGHPSNRSMFSRKKYMFEVGVWVEVYINEGERGYTMISRGSEYEYHLIISVDDDRGIVQYQCTTNP